MDPRQNFINIQQLIANHSNEILSYLNDVVKKSIDGTCRQEKIQGRLFDNIAGVQLPTNVDTMFSESVLFAFIEEKFSAWDATINEENIDYIKTKMVDFIFQSIEKNELWQTFLDDQKNKVEPIDIQKIRDYIASALTFKIISRWAAKKNLGAEGSELHKFTIFTLIINHLINKDEIINEQIKKTNQFIKNEIGKIFSIVIRNEIKADEISKMVDKKIANIRRNPHFLAIKSQLQDNERTIYHHLLEEFERLVKSDKDKYHHKKLAEVILLDINKYHSNNIEIQEIKDVIKKIRPFIGSKVKKISEDLLKKYDLIKTKTENEVSPPRKLVISLSEEKNKSITFFGNDNNSNNSNNNNNNTVEKQKSLVRSASGHVEDEKRKLTRSSSGHWAKGAFKPKDEDKPDHQKALHRPT